MDKQEIELIIEENERRKKVRERIYDPIKGIGCYGRRVEYDATRWGEGIVWLPADMVIDPAFINGHLDKPGYRRLRVRYDFEYWCVLATKVKDKRTHRMVPFVLNRGQSYLLKILEDQRLAGKPVRVILLKARQWGGSTLVQYYMAWWQLVLYRGCNSLIAGHRKDNAITIRQMYMRLLENYPKELENQE